MTEKQHNKPTKYFIDFENVHGAGLKGVDTLDERDEVIIIYSQAAETFHIEHAIDILKSKAGIRFVEVDGGTRNAADFQLIVALYGNMSDEFDYAIVSGDGGFDAAIKMGERMGLPFVKRVANVQGDEAEKVEKPKSRRTRRSRSGRDAAAEAPQQPEGENASPEAQDQAQSDEASEAQNPPALEAPAGNAEAQSDAQAEEQAAASKRRSRRRRRSNGSQDAQAATQSEATQPANNASADVAASAGAEAEKPARETAEPTVDQASETASVDAAAADKAPTEEAPVKEAPGKGSKSAMKKKASPKVHEEARQDSAAARAKAAEVMRLALAEPAKNAEKPPASMTVEGAEKETDPVSSEQNAIAAIKAVLAEKGVQLTDQQLATVAGAIDGAEGRQDFYRRIIKVERQEKGRALYRQVREHYEALAKAVR